MNNKLPSSKQAPAKKKASIVSTKNKENEIVESHSSLKNDHTLTINEILKIINPESIFGEEYKPTNLVLYRDILTDLKQVQNSKNEICRNWQQGNCSLSQQCKFIHDVQETKKQVKLIECFTFSNYGFCSKGEACEMIHPINTPSLAYQIQLNNTQLMAEQSIVKENRLLVFINLEEKGKSNF